MASQLAKSRTNVLIGAWNYNSAVNLFCGQIKTAIAKLGPFNGSPSQKLRELITQFECCDWVPEDPSLPDPSTSRTEKKKNIC
jgi:hypothetical protein